MPGQLLAWVSLGGSMKPANHTTTLVFVLVVLAVVFTMQGEPSIWSLLQARVRSQLQPLGQCQ